MHLSDEQQQQDENNQQATDTISVAPRRNPRVSVDIAERFGEAATISSARARRSSAPGFKSADQPNDERVTRELSSNAAPVARAFKRNTSGLLAGAWDPRAERVITEAEERLKEAVTEIAGKDCFQVCRTPLYLSAGCCYF